MLVEHGPAGGGLRACIRIMSAERGTRSPSRAVRQRCISPCSQRAASNDEVIFPSLNFVAAANAVTHTGPARS